MEKTVYYFILDELPSSPNYKKAVALSRMRREDGGAYPERWNGKEWVEDRDVIAACGIGGDNPFLRTTRKKK